MPIYSINNLECTRQNNILFQGIFLPCYRHSTSDINLILKAFKNYKDIKFFITSPNFDKGSKEIKKI